MILPPGQVLLVRGRVWFQDGSTRAPSSGSNGSRVQDYLPETGLEVDRAEDGASRTADFSDALTDVFHGVLLGVGQVRALKSCRPSIKS